MHRMIALALTACITATASAWDSHGHAVVTYLALESAGDQLPTWILDADAPQRIAYGASEADRWRATRMSCLAHENAPDHYIDLEYLKQYGLSPQSLPLLRYDYLRAMAVAKAMHPERVDEYDPASDPNGTREWPGFLPYAIMEQYAKVRSSFHTVRMLEAINDPKRANQLMQAKANAYFHMGMLSHFVGDAAQPLHTTKHFNGWAGENPNGYTTERGIHAYIDGGVLERHGISFTTLQPMVGAPTTVNDDNPWSDAMAHIDRSFREVERLYAYEKSGALDNADGRLLIEERLLDASQTLAGFYIAAWNNAAPSDRDIETFLKYTGYLTPETPARQVNFPE